MEICTFHINILPSGKNFLCEVGRYSKNTLVGIHEKYFSDESNVFELEFVGVVRLHRHIAFRNCRIFFFKKKGNQRRRKKKQYLRRVSHRMSIISSPRHYRTCV